LDDVESQAEPDGRGRFVVRRVGGDQVACPEDSDQLFVDSATDSRVDRFINDLRLNSAVTPEFGATCTNPDFKANPSPPDPSGAAAPSASG